MAVLLVVLSSFKLKLFELELVKFKVESLKQLFGSPYI